MKKRIAVTALMLLALGLTPNARADSKYFTYSYQADSILEKKAWEFEQWLTYRAAKATGNFYRFDLREEIETGLTPRLTTALYLNFTDIHREGVVGETDLNGMEFKGISSEWKYMVASPNLHPLGLLLYFEPTYEGETLELEGKVIVQHNFGDKVVWVGNAVFAPEWAFAPAGTEKELELEFTTGLAYKFAPHWSAGLEARNTHIFADFKNHEPTSFSVGPNIHWEGAKGWATFTVLPQLTRELHDHEKVEARLVAGVLF